MSNHPEFCMYDDELLAPEKNIEKIPPSELADLLDRWDTLNVRQREIMRYVARHPRTGQRELAVLFGCKQPQICRDKRTICRTFPGLTWFFNTAGESRRGKER